MKIEFKVNYQKTLESILYLLSKRDDVNLYNVMKALYAADKQHLNKYGRPVTGDVYFKKTYGVLPDVAYAFFNNDPMVLSSLDLDKSPIVETSKHHYKPTRKPQLKYLSKSDLAALDFGVDEYFDMDFNAVADKNHKEQSWIKAEYNSPINIADMIENLDVLKELDETSPFAIVV